MRRGYKWAAFALAFILFLVLGGESVPLTDRAVVTGIGIDLSEEGYRVSAEIVMPTDSESKNAGYIIATGEGASLSEALMSLSVAAGRQLSLSHCNAVVLGFELMRHDAVTALDYVARNAYLSENAVLVGAEGRAEEVLSSKPAFSETGSFFLQSALTEYGYYPERTGRNVKDFLIAYNTASKGNWLSLTRITETQSAENGEDSGGSPEYLLSFAETAVFDGEDYVMRLPERGTRGINYVESRLEEGSITVSAEGKTYTAFIENIKTRKSFSKDLTATFKTTAKLVLKETDGDAVSVRPDDAEPDAGVQHAFSESIAGDIRFAFEETKQYGVDIFGLYEGFYAAEGKNFKPGNYLDGAKLKIEVELDFV